MYVGYISFGKIFIFLWMFDPAIFPMTSVITAAKVMAILSLANLLILMGAFSRSLLAATGHIGFSAKMTVLEALINLTVSISLVIFFNWGLIGIAAGTLGSHLLIQTIIMPYYACNKAGINWFNFVMNVGSKALASGILFFLSCYSVQRGFEVRTWIGFFIQITISAACYLPIIWFILFSTDDRKRVIKKFSNQS